MATAHHRSELSMRPGNLNRAERWLSLIAGTGLALSALRRRGLFSRALGSAAAFSLISRGSTGYCGMKAAFQGQASLRDGIREQWQRVSTQLGSSAAREINDLQQLYAVELQELCSAESQLIALIAAMGPNVQSSSLAVRLDEYAAELRSRKADLDNLLATYRIDATEHPDDAMRSLAREAMKMTQLCAPELRDAALTASVQRIIHYKIAGYGTIAAYAKSLNRDDEAARFANCAERDKAVDGELTELAKSSLNPKAAAHVEPGATARKPSARPRPH
jgi:ferritin-like metal-binding protein YciE